jgi:type II secretory pathway pseudopilin PulG
MKLKNQRQSQKEGFTVAEMSVAVGVLGLLGMVFFSVLFSGLTLSTKNIAVNVAHAEARDGINRLTRDIHAAVSVPQLRDGNFAVVTSQPTGAAPTPPAASGVSFQNVASGPNYIWKDPGNPSLIMIKDNPKPVPGQHLVIPFWGSLYEQDITKVTAGGSANHSNVFLANGTETNINPRLTGNAYAIIYYTDRVLYLVQNGHFVPDPVGGRYTTISGNNGNGNNFYSTAAFKVAPANTSTGQLYRYENGELHIYKQRYTGSAFFWEDQAPNGIVRNLTSPYPFYIPLNSGGTANTKYVGVDLSASDPKSSNRGYLATNSLLSTTIDYRASITLTQ